MKILIISDTHKSRKNLDTVLETVKDINMLIHLGDVEGDEDYIEEMAGCPTHIIGGNNDFFSNLPREKEIFVEGYHIFITHGHYYHVGVDERRLKQEARGRGADVVMYGHTHRPSINKEADGLVILNPGSLAYPRQAGRRATYAIMEIDRDGKANFELKYM